MPAAQADKTYPESAPARDGTILQCVLMSVCVAGSNEHRLGQLIAVSWHRIRAFKHARNQCDYTTVCSKDTKRAPLHATPTPAGRT